MNTYSKLHDGSWGVRVQGVAKNGDVVVVQKRNGQSTRETVDRVIWAGSGVSLCSLVRSQPQGSTYRGRRGRRCPECGGPNPYGDPCAEPCD